MEEERWKREDGREKMEGRRGKEEEGREMREGNIEEVGEYTPIVQPTYIENP